MNSLSIHFAGVNEHEACAAALGPMMVSRSEWGQGWIRDYRSWWF